MCLFILCLVSFCIVAVVAPGGGGRGGGGGSRSSGSGSRNGGGRGAGAAGGAPRVITSGVTTSRSSTFMWYHSSSHSTYSARPAENPNGILMNCTKEASSIITCDSPGTHQQTCTISLSYGTTCYIYDEQRDCIEKTLAQYGTTDAGVIDLHTPATFPHFRETTLNPLEGTDSCSIVSVLDPTKKWQFHWECVSNTTCIVSLKQDLCARLVSLVECEKAVQDDAVFSFFMSTCFLIALSILIISFVAYFLYRRKRSVDTTLEVTEETHLVNDGYPSPYKTNATEW